MTDWQKSLAKHVNEFDEYMGLYVYKSKDIQNVNDARRAMLDFYHKEHSTHGGRMYWCEYGCFGLEHIEEGEIEETISRRCNQCHGNWMGDDDYCYGCDHSYNTAKLDDRTKKTVFVLYSVI